MSILSPFLGGSLYSFSMEGAGDRSRWKKPGIKADFELIVQHIHFRATPTSKESPVTMETALQKPLHQCLNRSSVIFFKSISFQMWTHYPIWRHWECRLHLEPKDLQIPLLYQGAEHCFCNNIVPRRVKFGWHGLQPGKWWQTDNNIVRGRVSLWPTWHFDTKLLSAFWL